MKFDPLKNKYDLTKDSTRAKLKMRSRPYFMLLAYGRHVGYQTRVKDSYWVARFRTIHGVYRQKRLGIARDQAHPKAMSFPEAEIAARTWFVEMREHTIASHERLPGVNQRLRICPIGDEPTIGHALHEYVEWKRLAASQSHFETNLSLINHHLVPTVSSILVSEFDGQKVRELVKHILETPPKRGNQTYSGVKRPIHTLSDEALRKRKKTVNTVLGILRTSLQMAWENGKTNSDRSWRSIRYLPTVDRPRTLFLCHDECMRLVRHCREDTRRLVLAALYTGCRITELLRMRCGDVGREGYGVYVQPVKAYRSRFVFLPDEAMAWFLEIIKNRNLEEKVFLRNDGAAWPDRSFRYDFVNAKKKAGIPKEFTFHGLRHTYASHLIQRGVSIFTVAEQLGHADPTTVLRTYGHLSPKNRCDEIREGFAQLDQTNVRLAKKHKNILQSRFEQSYGYHFDSYRERIQRVNATGIRLLASDLSMSAKAAKQNT